MQSKPLFIIVRWNTGAVRKGREEESMKNKKSERVIRKEELFSFLRDLSLLTWVKPKACLPRSCPENLGMVMHEGAVSLCCYNHTEIILHFRWNWFKTTWASSHFPLVPLVLPLVSFKYSWMPAYSAIFSSSLLLHCRSLLLLCF